MYCGYTVSSHSAGHEAGVLSMRYLHHSRCATMVARCFTKILCMASILGLVKYLATTLSPSEVRMYVIIVLSFYSVDEHYDVIVGCQ